MQAVIMAGGKGTRLAALTKDEIPKPMLPVGGKPILQWQVESLVRGGITDIILCVGHLGDRISAYFSDGSAFGARIRCYFEDTPLGSAGALAYIRPWLEDTFFLLSGDLVLDIDWGRMLRCHREKGAEVTLFAHPNSHPYDSDLIVSDRSGFAIRFDSKHNRRDYWYDNCVNAGILAAGPSFCDRVVPGRKANLENDILRRMIEERRPVYVYRSSEYVRDAGTPERIAAVERDLASGYVSSRSLSRPQKCIFLDRDGTVNRENGFISREEEFVLEPRAAEAIRRINASGYLAIVATNQPVVARGECTMEDLENIHNKMKTLLGQEGAYLDDCVFCPHHPDKGFPGENPDYKRDCACRKPRPGLLFACAEKYNIDLSASWMVGDTTTDLETGRNAGTHTALVRTGLAGGDGKYSADAEIAGRDILDAVERILDLETK